MIKMYVATISNPDILYVGMDNDMKRKFFRGLTNYWAVWDNGVMNAPRLVLDDMGKPKGFIPFICKDGILKGYLHC